MKLSNGHYIVNPPKVSWVLVANRSEAVVFRKEKLEALGFVERFVNPSGRLKESDLGTDRPGITGAGTHHSLGRGPKRHEQAAIDFAVDLTAFLDKAHKQERFEELVLVAEPHFLGLLRKSLPANLKNIPLFVIAKDIKGIDTETVEKKLEVLWRRPKGAKRVA